MTTSAKPCDRCGHMSTEDDRVIVEPEAQPFHGHDVCENTAACEARQAAR